MGDRDLGIDLQFKELAVTSSIVRWMYGASLGMSIKDLPLAAKRICATGIAIGAVTLDRWEGTITDRLRILNRIDRKFADLGYPRILRALLAPIQVRRYETAHDATEDKNNIFTLSQYLLLHHNGSMVISVNLELKDTPLFIKEIIEFAEIGLESTLLDYKIPSNSSHIDNWNNLGRIEHGWIKKISLETFVNYVMIPTIGKTILGRPGNVIKHSVHPLGQYTVNILVNSSPQCQKINSFVETYKTELKSISDMDIVGYTRAIETVQDRFNQNYSIDSEVGVYLGHRAGTVIFEWPKIEDWFTYAERRYYQGVEDKLILSLEIYQHYLVFIEWLLIEESSIRGYLQRLNSLIRFSYISVKNIISKKRQMLKELEEFRDMSTSFDYGTRIIGDLSKSRRVDQLQERFERKRAIVKEIVIDSENWRLQTLMSVLSVVLLASLFLELVEIPLQYLNIAPGSTEWVSYKLLAVSLVPVVFLGYWFTRSTLRFFDFIVVNDLVRAALRSGIRIYALVGRFITYLWGKITAFFRFCREIVSRGATLITKWVSGLKLRDRFSSWFSSMRSLVQKRLGK